MVREIAADIVLLDVNLPGHQRHRGMPADQDRGPARGFDRPSDFRFRDNGASAAAALNVGADSCLVEPIDPDVLIATVNAFLRLRHAERALAAANQALSEKNAELNSANNALESSNRDLEDFAYIASHDMQEPLRTISTHIELLDRSVAARFDESERHIFGFVREAARRMGQLISVLAYSSIRREAPPLKPTNLGEAMA
jgi:signal transduction histidine kinase